MIHTIRRCLGPGKTALPERAFLAVLLWMMTANAPQAMELPCGLASTGVAAAISVIDGDTIETDIGAIRLADIEAPKGFGFGGEDTSISAAETLNNLAAGRSWTIAPVKAEPDRYGRIHAHLFNESGSWLQEQLVRGGSVRVRPAAGESGCFQPLLEIEAEARATQVGFWADAQHHPKSAVDPSLSKQMGLYELVEGRIRSVGRGRYMVFLDFGTNFRRDFTVMVPIAAETRFEEKGVSLDSLAGKRIRVRGVIEASGGPAIRVSDPALIEVLDEE